MGFTVRGGREAEKEQEEEEDGKARIRGGGGNKEEASRRLSGIRGKGERDWRYER